MSRTGGGSFLLSWCVHQRRDGRYEMVADSRLVERAKTSWPVRCLSISGACQLLSAHAETSRRSQGASVCVCNVKSDSALPLVKLQ